MTEPTPLYLHIGLPKTGTTYLQNLLMANRAALLRAGLNYPTIGEPDHFLAALDAAGRTRFVGADLPRRRGAWQALARELLAHDEAGLMSHEILAGVSPATALKIRERLASRPVHIVATVRDPARQLLADWQEHIKIRRTMTFEEYVAKAGIAHSLDAKDTAKNRPFLGQQLLRALRIWSKGLQPSQVHVVTLPPAGSEPELLWRRFAEAVSVADPDSFSVPHTAGTNERLGVASTELLRRVNVALGGRMSGADYGAIVKDLYAQQLLPRISSTEPGAMPHQLRPRVLELAEFWIAGIREAGYRVHGDLDDLRPRFAEGPLPSQWKPDEVITEASESIAALLGLVHDLTRRGDRIADPGDLAAALPRRISLENARLLAQRVLARTAALRRH